MPFTQTGNIMSWDQAMEDSLKAHADYPRELPYYGEIRPAYKQVTKTPKIVEVSEKSGSTSSKRSKLMSFLKHDSGDRAASVSQSSMTSDGSSVSSKRSIWKNPVVTGQYLPMYRLEESMSGSLVRK